MRIGLVALACVMTMSVAHAGERTVGVVVVGSGATPKPVEAAVIRQLREDGFVPVEAPLSRDGMNTLANCMILEDLTCARGVVEARAQTGEVVFVRTDDGIDVVWFSAGHDPVSRHRDCTDCSAALVHELAGVATAPSIVIEERTPVRKRRSRWIPTALVGAGAVTLVTGSVLLYYGLRDGASHKYVYPQLTPVGITLIAVGGGAVIGGIITW